MYRLYQTSFKRLFCYIEQVKDLDKWMKFETCEENILSAMINRANDILLKYNEEVRHLDESD